MSVTGFQEISDGHHGFTPTTTTVASRIRAAVEALSGSELERAQMIDPRSSHQVRLRYRLGVKAGMTVTFHDGRRGDRAFEIVAPPLELDDHHEDMRLLCKEAE